jgi:hypothetical protein
MEDKELAKIIIQAVSERVKRSAAVWIYKDERRLHQFTSILLELNGHFLALTAKHCIKKINSRSSLQVATFGAQSPGLSTTPLNLGMLNKMDLGFIEIRPEVANQLNSDWLSINALNSNFARPGELVVFIGFPYEFFQVEQSGPRYFFHPRPIALTTEVSPRLPSAAPADPTQDFFIEWHDTEFLNTTTSQAIDPFHPAGMSGSGVFWIPRPITGEIWDTSKILLTGVCVSVINSEHLMRCSRIENILTLLGYKVMFKLESSDGLI